MTPANTQTVKRLDFEGHALPVYRFRDRECVVAAQVGEALEYADHGKKLVDHIRDDWGGELIKGKDYDILTGAGLRDFKAIVGDTRGVSFSARLTVLYEAGVDLVLLKTEKPVAVALRRLLADEVMPALRNGHSIGGQITGEEMMLALRPTIEALTGKVDMVSNQVDDLKLAALDTQRRAAEIWPGKASVEVLDEIRFLVKGIGRKRASLDWSKTPGEKSAIGDTWKDLFAAVAWPGTVRSLAAMNWDTANQAKSWCIAEVRRLDAAIKARGKTPPPAVPRQRRIPGVG